MNLINRIRQSSDNTQIIVKNTLGAFTVKGLSLIVSVLTTPAFIRYFNNNEVLGVWFTMLSVLIWFLNFDLGIGNGIRNQLVYDITNKDYQSTRKTLASGFFATGTVTIILTLVGLCLLFTTNLNTLFNVDSQLLAPETLLYSSIAIFIALMLRFFLTTISSIYYALQKSAVNNLLSLIVSIFQLLYVVIFKFDDINQALINLAIAYCIISNIPTIVAGFLAFCGPLKKCVPSFSDITKDRIAGIMRIGIMFFVCQILYMCIANTNEFLITRLYGASYTSEYSFYYKLMSIVSIPISLALAPVWSVVTKAIAENNFIWLSGLYKRIKKIGAIAILLQFIMIPFMQVLFDIWLGKGQVMVNYVMAISFACFFGLFVYSGMLSTIANGMARMKIPMIAFSIGVVAKFSIDILLYKYINNWNLVVWSNVAAFLPYIILQQLDLNKFFSKQIPA